MVIGPGWQNRCPTVVAPAFARVSLGSVAVLFPLSLVFESGQVVRVIAAGWRFAAALARHTGIPVTLADEWLSTRQAHARLREAGNKQRDSRDRIDSAAAAVLLQSWLDGRSAGGEP